MDQTKAPYLDAVIEYVRRDPSRLHVPGHKGIASDPELIEAIGMAALEHDISAGLKGIDLGPAPTPFQQSQDLAADAWGAARSWFLLHGGFTTAVRDPSSYQASVRNARSALSNARSLLGIWFQYPAVVLYVLWFM